MEKPLTRVGSEWIAEEFQLQYVVKNFSLVKSGNYVSSPELPTIIAGELTKWTIRVYPYWSAGIRGGLGVLSTPAAVSFPVDTMVSVHLLLNTEIKTSTVSYELLLFNFQGEQIGNTFFCTSQFCKGTVEGINNIMLRDYILQRILPGDTLTIIFKCKVPSNFKNCNSHTTNISSLIDDLARLRLEADFSDISFMVSGREFKAHKTILAARSPVLSSMFKHNMKETNSGKIEIEDTRPEIFEEFLAFLYTGKANIKDYARELFAVADKYDVKNLKASCENELIEIINKENYLKILVLSDLHSSKELKEKCLNFMVSTKIDVDKNELAAINNPPLMIEIVEALLKSNK